MTNPNNAVGTNGAFGGRTSVNAFNDDLASYSAGILSGWACAPNSGLSVVIGGDGNTRDVAVAEDNAGNKTTINNISGVPIVVTVDNPPTTNARVDSIVAYVDNPPTGSATATDNYEACGLIVVAGTASSTPSAPNDSVIRTAITNDGASGTTAYYVVLANVTVASGTTDLVEDNITAGNNSKIGVKNINLGGFPGNYSETEIDTGFTWVDGKKIYKKTVNFGALPNNTSKTVAHNISNLGSVIKIEAIASKSGEWRPLPITDTAFIVIVAKSANIEISSNWNTSSYSSYVTLYYTKSA